jgi:hypothetical protein
LSPPLTSYAKCPLENPYLLAHDRLCTFTLEGR